MSISKLKIIPTYVFAEKIDAHWVTCPSSAYTTSMVPSWLRALAASRCASVSVSEFVPPSTSASTCASASASASLRVFYVCVMCLCFKFWSVSVFVSASESASASLRVFFVYVCLRCVSFIASIVPSNDQDTHRQRRHEETVCLRCVSFIASIVPS